ncbi:zinc ribbon domain-containing protein [bacterium]|nr:zinc ribbon domain-containing protein [bacterium]
MPIYEYKCESCGKIFSRFIKSINSNYSVNCPECNNSDVKRLFSSFSSVSGSVNNSAGSCGSNRFT